MKSKTFFSVLFFFISNYNSYAQDTISYSDGTQIYGKLLMIEGHNIHFKINGSTGQSNQASATNQSSSIPDCENKDIGEIEFKNETELDCSISIYAIGSSPQNSMNPVILYLTVPPNESRIAYEISSGAHYVYSMGRYGEEYFQIPVTKCQVYKYTIKKKW